MLARRHPSGAIGRSNLHCMMYCKMYCSGVASHTTAMRSGCPRGHPAASACRLLSRDSRVGLGVKRVVLVIGAGGHACSSGGHKSVGRSARHSSVKLTGGRARRACSCGMAAAATRYASHAHPRPRLLASSQPASYIRVHTYSGTRQHSYRGKTLRTQGRCTSPRAWSARKRPAGSPARAPAGGTQVSCAW